MSREDGHGWRPPQVKRTVCKRCGSTQVAWVQSKRTQRWYLAFAVDRAVYAHQPHKCDDPLVGGKLPPAELDA